MYLRVVVLVHRQEVSPNKRGKKVCIPLGRALLVSNNGRLTNGCKNSIRVDSRDSLDPRAGNRAICRASWKGLDVIRVVIKELC